MRVFLVWLSCMSLTHPAAAADMEVDPAATANNDSLAFDPNAQSPALLPVSEGSGPNPATDETLGAAKRIEVSRRLKAAGHHWSHTCKDFVAKLVDSIPDTEATTKSLWLSNCTARIPWRTKRYLPKSNHPPELPQEAICRQGLIIL
jgi:hypothetical protein